MNPKIIPKLVFLTSIFICMPLFFSGFSFAAVPSGVLKPESGLASDYLSVKDRNVVVLVHGWNPKEKPDPYAVDEWYELVSALKQRLQGTDWNLQLFDWHEDASTGFILDENNEFITTNALQAASNSYSNATNLTFDIEKAKNLRRLVLIAHSAGTWAAEKAAEILLEDNTYLEINLILLDPYVPDVNQNVEINETTLSKLADPNYIASTDRFFRLENYNAIDLLTDVGGDTSKTFSWESASSRHIDPLHVDYGFYGEFSYANSTPQYFIYNSHSGPIRFYADSINFTQGGVDDEYAFAPYNRDQKYGFPKSLIFAYECFEGTYNCLPKINKQLKMINPAEGQDQTVGPGSGGVVIVGEQVTLSVEAGLAEPYLWYKNGQPCDNPADRCYSSGPTLTFDSVIDSDKGGYVVRIGNNAIHEYGYTFSDKFDLRVSPVIPPTIDLITPQTLDGLPAPETQEITITGTGFTNESKLIFFDGYNIYNKTPIYDGPTQLRYDIAVGNESATWTVRVDNNGVKSSAFSFYVNPIPQPPKLSPRPEASDGDYDDRVRVSWYPIKDASSHELYRCTTISTADCRNITVSTGTSFDDFNVINATTYYYRIKACNNDGCTTYYSDYDAGHRGSSVAPPPSDLNASDGLYTNGVIVYWPPVSGATHYQIQRATSLTGSRTTLSSNFTYTTYADTQTVADRLYYYWARACNSNSVCGAYGDPDTGYRASEAPALQPAINPNPVNGATSVSIKLGELSWENGGGANSYDVYFGTNPTPGQSEFFSWTGTNRKSLPDLTYNTTYYWRVDSKANGQTIPGPIWSFTTRSESAPDLPERAINPTPAHYAEDIPLSNTMLRWENGGGATSYDVYFGRNFQPGDEQYLGNTTNTFWPLPTLEYDKIYYWRIKARNAGGAGKGDVWRFTTEHSAPDPVIWPHPQDSQTDVSVNTSRLSWTDSSGKASSFDVYFGTDPSPDASEFQVNTTRNEWNLPSLALNTTYYWQIISKNKAGSTPGPIWHFTTWASTPGTLKVSEGGFIVQGEQGGPFSGNSKTYKLTNIGQDPINFTVTNSYEWLTINPTSGSLAPQQTTQVTVSLNTQANTLTQGIYRDALSFNNTSNNNGNDARAVILTVDETITPWDVKKIISSYWQSAMAINANGTLVGWGGNTNSHLGLGAQAPLINPAPIPLTESFTWSDIASSYTHTLAITQDGALYAWGFNNVGQLGLGDDVQRHIPTRVGTDNDWKQVSVGSGISFALKQNGQLFAFGLNLDGQLGVGDQVNRNIPTQVGTDSDWRYVSAKMQIEKTLAIKDDGRLYVWGFRVVPENTIQPSPKQFGTDSDWSTVVHGGGYYLALKTNGSLFAWGANNRGQLGLGDFIDRELPTQVGTDNDWVDIAAGSGHSLALKKDGRLYAWGHNFYGQLGVGDRLDRNTPQLVNLANNISSINANEGNSFVLLDNGEIFGWGNNNLGQLGLGYISYEKVSTPRKINLNWAVTANAQPTVNIADPSNNVINTGLNSYPISGSSSDNDGIITEVQYRVNYVDWETAIGISNWSFIATQLTLGNNLIEVRSRDDDGLYSPVTSLIINRLVDFDSDHDGIPDSIELNWGLNPLDPNDATLDKDGDGVNNLNEYLNGRNATVNENALAILPKIITQKSQTTNSRNKSKSESILLNILPAIVHPQK